MRNLSAGLKVGITFLLAAAAGYWAFTMLAKGGCAGEEPSFTVHAYFKDATLLVEKSRVQISGLNVGHIVSRKLDVSPPREELVRSKRFALITVALQPGVVLYENAVVSKRSASLLGEFYLEIDPGTATIIAPDGSRRAARRLKDGDEIRRVGEAATTGGVVQQVSDILPMIKGLGEDIRSFITGPLSDVSKGINRSLEENRRAVVAILANIERITKDVSGVTAGTGDDVRSVVQDVKHITQKLREMVDRGAGKLDGYGDRVNDGLERINKAVSKLDRSLTDVNKVTRDLAEGKGSVGRLLTDDTLVRDIEGVVKDAGDLVGGIAQLQTIVGLRSEYNFQAGSIKTYVTVELRPRPDKYYLIELIDDPRGRRTVSSTTTRTDDPSKPPVVRSDQIEVTDSFRITFQFAKRLGFATFRFGIKESTGGLGVDLHFWKDRVRLQMDIFDFQANVYPRFKAMAAFEFFHRLYVVGGIDDAFNARPEGGTEQGGGRDYFLGAQIRFNDEDLKQLLLVGGSALGGSASGK